MTCQCCRCHAVLFPWDIFITLDGKVYCWPCAAGRVEVSDPGDFSRRRYFTGMAEAYPQNHLDIFRR